MFTVAHISCVLHSGIRFPPSESASTNLQEKLLREAAAFIITHQIPDFVRVFSVSDFVLQENSLGQQNQCIIRFNDCVRSCSVAYTAMRRRWTEHL